ncbi:M15 family metallopeptidase [Microgenomates group bacterium]|nr:M15 family metallopeptidase [Microgenomates group bacterium]
MKEKKWLITLIVLAMLVSLGILASRLFFDNNNGTSLEPIRRDPTAQNNSEVDLLILVNKDSKIPDDYHIELTKLDEVEVARVMINDLVGMRDAAAAEGISLSVNSAYRSKAEQQKIYDEIADKNKVALSGYSEHETGLAIDFALQSDDDGKDMKTWIWLSRNAYKYGFIHRYPEDKAHLTGISWEPWHYRYVGQNAAREMFEQDLVLEEYLLINATF